MPIESHVRAFFDTHGLHGQGLVGVSGGLDSVVLLHVLREVGLEVVVAHVNYGLRGAASDADEQFVEEMALRLGVPLHIHRVPPEQRPDRSRQAWAREVRYAWFDALAAARGLGWVAVAHHASDQAETVLLSLLRGTGVAGLGGMRPVRRLAPGSDVRLVRPLLEVPRATLWAYGEQHGLAWREDDSNADARYRRAWLRTQLMPLLRARFGDEVEMRITRTAALARERLVVPGEARQAALRARAFTPDGVRLDVLRTLAMPARLRLLLDALEHFLPAAPRSAAVATRLGALVEAQVGRRVAFGAGRVWRERDRLRFVPAPGDIPFPARELQPGTSAEVPGGWIEASWPEAPPGDVRLPPEACLLDADGVTWPLVVRPWRRGDKLQPFGMEGRKKISDLLTDARVPTSERDGVPVVCSGAEIIWVPGVRAGEATRLRPGTRRVVLLRLHTAAEGLEKLPQRRRPHST